MQWVNLTLKRGEIMKSKEVKSNLCYYDKRNPDNSLIEDLVEESDKKTPCYCDNCFYGRTEMAEYILKLEGEAKCT